MAPHAASLSLAQAIQDIGFALVPDVLAESACEFYAVQASRPAATVGTRDLLRHNWCRSLAAGLRASGSLAPLFQTDLVAVQCTYFEKSASDNWLVPIHQDLSIPVADRVEHPELRGWSEKEGALYVRAPVALLRQLLAVRIHLAPCAADDGALRLVPRSHRAGIVHAEEAATLRLLNAELVCADGRGSALAMRPLVLHASSKTQGTGRRRVLHFLFGPRQLPFGLQWRIAA